MDCKNIALVCALLLRTRNVKKRKKFWVHPITSSRLLGGKFYSLYEDPKAHPQTFFLDILEYLVKHLITAGFALSKSYISRYQNNRIRATRKKVRSNIKIKENFYLIFHTHFVIFLSGTDKKFRYSSFITVLSSKCLKIRMIDWIIHTTQLGNLQSFFIFDTVDVFWYTRL
jgi:hypothetical protein